MKSNYIDLTGKRYGYLTVISLKQNGRTRRSWTVRCDCGNEIVIGEAKLLGITGRPRPNKSCGCKQCTRDGMVVKYPKLYNSWRSIIASCYITSSDNYERYGGKGITVCDEWKYSFDNFLDWSLNNGYSDELYIGRIDIAKDFSPSNCNYSDRYEHMQKRGILKNNKTGVTGVYYYPDKPKQYRADIARNGVRKYLGSFDTFEEAVEARKIAEDFFNKHGSINKL